MSPRAPSGNARLPGCDVEVSASQAGSRRASEKPHGIHLQSGNALGALSCRINLQCGKAVLVWDGWNVSEARYHPSEDGWWLANTHPTDAHDGQIYPTHWMPLPPPPEGSGPVLADAPPKAHPATGEKEGRS